MRYSASPKIRRNSSWRRLLGLVALADECDERLLARGCGASRRAAAATSELEMIGSHPQTCCRRSARRQHLRKVNVSSCELRVLPAAINFLVALEELDCSQN